MRIRSIVWLLALAGTMAIACGPPAVAPAKPAAAQPPAAAAPAVAQAPPTAPAAAAAPAPLPRQTMKYGYVPILAAGPMYLAYERGYFTEQGIDLEMLPFDSGALMVPAVSAGQLDAAHGVPGPALFNALARDVNLRAVSMISFNGTQLMLRKDLADGGQIRSVADLKGKRVSLMVEGSPVDYVMRRVLTLNGLTLQDIELLRLSMPDTVPALANAALDAGAVVEPFLVLIESRGIGVRSFAVQEQVGRDTAAIVLIGPSMLSRPDAAKTAFLVGFVKGLRDFQATLQDSRVADPAVLEIVSRWTNIPTDIVARAAISGALPDGRIDLDDLNRQQDYWLQEGDVRTRADLGALVDYSYLDAAVAQLR